MSGEHASELETAQDYWRRGDIEASRDAYRAILDQDPGCSDALLQLGHLERESGRFDAAEALHRRAAEQDGDAAAHTALGRTLSDSGRGREAAKAYLAAIQADDKYVPAYLHLGELYGNVGQLAAARECFVTAARLDPEDPFPRHNLGIAAQLAGDNRAAVTAFRAALELRPDYWRSWQALGDLFRASGLFAPALHSYEQLIALRPDADNLLRLGATLQLMARYDDAITAYNQVLELAPGNTDAVYNLGTCYQAMGDLDRAEPLLRTVIGQKPDDVAAIAALAGLHDRRGEYDRGFELLQPLTETSGDNAEVWVSLGKLARHSGRAGKVLPQLEQALEQQQFNDVDRSRIGFSCGQLSDSSALYDRAFAHFRAANELKARTYRSEAFEQSVTRLIEIFDAALVQRLQQHGSNDSRPLFIVGMPRSGSTLLEQILSSHSDVATIGESALLPEVAAGLGGAGTPYPDCMPACSAAQIQQATQRYLAGLPDGSRYVVDKLLSNVFNAGLVAVLFPGARVLHSVRHPLDTLLSCYTHDFTGNHLDFSYSFADLAHYYRQYRRIMAHWKAIGLATMEVRYEDMVTETESTVRSLLEYLELPWNENCLNFFENRNSPNTASYAQVRQPIYRDSVGRHRNYRDHLQPLVDELADYLDA